MASFFLYLKQIAGGLKLILVEHFWSIILSNANTVENTENI